CGERPSPAGVEGPREGAGPEAGGAPAAPQHTAGPTARTLLVGFELHQQDHAPYIVAVGAQWRDDDPAAHGAPPPVDAVEDVVVDRVAGERGLDRLAQLLDGQADVDVEEVLALDLAVAQAPQLLG